MQPLIEQHRAEIALLCHRYGVRQLEVFGSAARGADFDPDRSDADFLVDFVRDSDLFALRQYFGFAEELAHRIPDIREIITFRNVLIHGYATIEHDRVWHITENSLPGLRTAVAACLDGLGSA